MAHKLFLAGAVAAATLGLGPAWSEEKFDLSPDTTKWLERGINRRSGNIYKYILIYIPKYEPHIMYVNNIISANISGRGMYISRYILINTLRL